jgi:hypothetical protein
LFRRCFLQRAHEYLPTPAHRRQRSGCILVSFPEFVGGDGFEPQRAPVM